MAEELNLTVDEDAFQAAQAHSKEASKGGAKTSVKDTVKLDVHDISALEKNTEVPITNDSFKFNSSSISATIKAIYHEKNFPSSTANIPTGASFGIILDKTCFYAEAGGQEYDTGVIALDMKDREAKFEVINCQSFKGYVLHIGDHIDQKGSLVAPAKLRFDFSHKAPVSLPELKKIEDICLEWIRKDVPVFSKDLDLKSARLIPGLRAVFGETYPDPVRVVSLEYDVDEISSDLENPKWRGTSVEFCGGTHVAKTGDIKEFTIMEESGIAKGIRRIIAVTGPESRAAMAALAQFELRFTGVQGMTGKEKDEGFKALTLDLNQADLPALLKADLKDRLAAKRKAWDTEVKAREAAATKEATESVANYFAENPDAQLQALQSIINQAKTLNKAVYVLSIDTQSGKVTHGNYLPPSLAADGFDARTWASGVSEIVGGRAGGKPDTAQGVGTDASKVADAVTTASELFAKAIQNADDSDSHHMHKKSKRSLHIESGMGGLSLQPNLPQGQGKVSPLSATSTLSSQAESSIMTPFSGYRATSSANPSYYVTEPELLE
ncbi:11044_t:CDS:2, partial [Acaulospora colombiana]